MKRFSIIIPAYNAQATIDRCLDSIYALPVSESDFEVIVIDDCSTDGTVAAIKRYGENHDNLTLLTQPHNHRQGAARNRGLSVAKGNYIVFLDSDDEVGSGILPAVSCAEKNTLEMIAIKNERISAGGERLKEHMLRYTPDDVFSGIDFQINHPYWCTAPWGYIYLKSFLDSVKYPFFEDVLYEDSDFVSVNLFHAKRMGYCDICAYYAYDNPSSTTNTVSYKNACDYALLGTRMLSFYHRIKDLEPRYADIILEGGSYNIMKSFRSIFRLESISDVRAFYDRLDSFVDRSQYLGYREPAYCWTKWTRFCLRHRILTIWIAGGAITSHLVDFRRIIKCSKHA